MAHLLAANADEVSQYMNLGIPAAMLKDTDQICQYMLMSYATGELTEMSIDQGVILMLAYFGHSEIGMEPLALAIESEVARINGLTDEEILTHYNTYLAGISDDVYLVLWQQHFEKTSNNTYEGNLLQCGIADEDNPSAIYIYPVSFDQKAYVQEQIALYNKDKEEKDQIVYTDYIGVLFSSISLILNIITYVLIAFVAISLVVSSIMIGIITYISVLERTKEIGILRAVGASKRDISRVFNAETLMIGFVAGLMGIIATLILIVPINAVIRALAGVSNIGASLPFVAAVALVLISMSLTVISGLIPSRVAAKKDPVEALRTE